MISFHDLILKRSWLESIICRKLMGNLCEQRKVGNVHALCDIKARAILWYKHLFEVQPFWGYFIFFFCIFMTQTEINRRYLLRKNSYGKAYFYLFLSSVSNTTQSAMQNEGCLHMHRYESRWYVFLYICLHYLYFYKKSSIF